MCQKIKLVSRRQDILRLRHVWSCKKITVYLYHFLFIGSSTFRAGTDGIQHGSAAAHIRVKSTFLLHLAFGSSSDS